MTDFEQALTTGEAVQALTEEVEALRGQMGYISGNRSRHVCEAGWVCEAHAHLGWPHDDCAGPGMPCMYRTDEAASTGSYHGWTE